MVKGRGQADCRAGADSVALIAIGANLPQGDATPRDAVEAAMDRLATVPGARRSRLYSTPAFPPGSGPDFVNAALAMPWADTAAALLDHLHAVEAEFGRTRRARWSARMMDLDLIAIGSKVLPDADTHRAWADLPTEEAARTVPPELILPHPRLSERSFVLVPLADVAPDWRHPVLGLSVVEMLAARPLAERADITPLA